MTLCQLLESRRDAVLEAANDALRRRHLRHYEESGAEAGRRRLAALLDLVCCCVRERRLDPMRDYASGLASRRFAAGFDLQEVLAAFNVVEEQLWAEIAAGLPAEEQGEAFGAVSTALGAGREALACAYVRLAGGPRSAFVETALLFQGTDSMLVQ